MYVVFVYTSVTQLYILLFLFLKSVIFPLHRISCSSSKHRTRIIAVINQYHQKSLSMFCRSAEKFIAIQRLSMTWAIQPFTETVYLFFSFFFFNERFQQPFCRTRLFPCGGAISRKCHTQSSYHALRKIPTRSIFQFFYFFVCLQGYSRSWLTLVDFDVFI